tara:strand:+ start:8392 stop:9099 length:708 start_codon:yes stop_codon:yes gene_type:complete
MFKILTPSNLFIYLSKIIKFIKNIFIPITIISLIIALIYSPEDYVQGDSVRIMYVHVPSAWMSIMCFSVIGFLSILSFLFKFKNTILFYKSLAPVGLLFSIIAIVTGSLWGLPTWGTFWVWDARLTSMLILMMLYIFFILSYKLISNQKISTRICAIISILGLTNIFVIKYSVRWWSTLHQTDSVRILGDTTVHFTMLWPLGLMLFVFSLFGALIFLMKYKTEVIRIKKKGLRRL